MPAVLWMLVIFFASTDAMSSRRTSRIIGPFLRWIIPSISDQAIRNVQMAVRKGGHVVEYAILAILLRRSLRPFRPAHYGEAPWIWPEAGAALALAILYAAADEYHQSFVPSRMGSPLDVGIDAVGATLGLLVMWGWLKWRQVR